MDDVERLREFLADRDAACPVCNYNLRALLSPRCPECGAALTLQVGSPEARFGFFLVTVAPMLMLAAFGMFIGIAWLPSLLRQPPGALLMFSAALADLVAMVALYRHRGAFFRLNRKYQLLCATASWVVHAGIFTVSLLLRV